MIIVVLIPSQAKRQVTMLLHMIYLVSPRQGKLDSKEGTLTLDLLI